MSGPNTSCLTFYRSVVALLTFFHAVQHLVNIQHYPGRLPSFQPCTDRRLATGRCLFNFVWASHRKLKLVWTVRRLLNSARPGRCLLNHVQLGHRMLTWAGRRLLWGNFET